MNYGDAAGFEAYFTDRNKDIPGTWDTAGINAALLVASEWIDGSYGSSFVGQKTGGFLQEREWPRTSATVVEKESRFGIKPSLGFVAYYTFGVNEIPERVVNATYEAAYRQLTSSGSLEVDYTPGKYKSVSIEGALDVEYRQISSYTEVQLQIGAVDRLLWPLLDSSMGGGMSNLSGGSSRV
jgi:hypothetical protein